MPRNDKVSGYGSFLHPFRGRGEHSVIGMGCAKNASHSLFVVIEKNDVPKREDRRQRLCLSNVTHGQTWNPEKLPNGHKNTAGGRSRAEDTAALVRRMFTHPLSNRANPATTVFTVYHMSYGFSSPVGGLESGTWGGLCDRMAGVPVRSRTRRRAP